MRNRSICRLDPTKTIDFVSGNGHPEEGAWRLAGTETVVSGRWTAARKIFFFI